MPKPSPEGQFSVSGHETRSTGTPKSRECQDMKPGPEGFPSPSNTDSQNPAKLGSPCQDMKPGPWGLQNIILYHYIGINTKQSLTGGG
jgi:hypothetical protein